MFRSLFLSCFFAIAALNAEPKRCCPDGERLVRGSIRHIESGGIGYDTGYTTFEMFLSANPNWWVVTPFLDVRGHVLDDRRWATNVGAGLRSIWGDRVYGINAYYDYREASRLHSNQIGLGLETLGKLFDFRINGYLPVGNKKSAPYNAIFGAFSGNSMLLSQKYQFAMKGADAEFGFHFGRSKNFDFYTAAGPYYFRGPIGPNAWGGKARISGTFKEFLTLELSDSYDNVFYNKFQGQISFNFSLGPRSKVKSKGRPCKLAGALNRRMLQPVGRQEIIVIDQKRKNAVAINPATGLPYFFMFVDNTSSSNGTYESPYHTLAQAEANSSPNDIIYIFPGDGTTTGMDSGIILKAGQQLMGSSVSHLMQTTQGMMVMPPQTSTAPTITNTNVDTEGNAITLATNNTISGITIASAINDAIYGTDLQSLDVSSCTFQDTTTYAIEATFPSSASISITNNQFLDNTNGVFFTLNGTSTVVCSNNTFRSQTSVSSAPIEIAANNNTLTAQIKDNIFADNTSGTVRCSFTSVVNADFDLLNNTITNNGTGSQSSLGSSFVVIATGTTARCSIGLSGNTFSGNTSNSLYMHTSGEFTTLDVTASTNTMTNNGGSSLVLATPTSALTLVATNNTMTGLSDNGIAVIASGTTATGTITISNNTLTNIGNSSNGIAINQDFTTLNLTLLDNEITGCEGTGVVSYAGTGIGSLTLNISGNTMSDCENGGSNAAAGLSLEQYTELAGSVTNNTFSGNTGRDVAIGSTLTAPTVCLTLSGNESVTGYLLSNPGDGTYNLAPCTASTVNTGTIDTSGTVTLVESCPDATPCPP